ncbi:unnamed protein product, partial [Ranitomeya imitator]
MVHNAGFYPALLELSCLQTSVQNRKPDKEKMSVSLSCTPSVSVIILYPECQCHYPVPRVSVSLSCTPSVSVIILYPSVSVIILYPECQCHYPVPRVSVSLSCTPSVSVIILYPSVSVIILYPECQCHYPVPRVDYRVFSHCGESFGPIHKKSSRRLGVGR